MNKKPTKAYRGTGTHNSVIRMRLIQWVQKSTQLIGRSRRETVRKRPTRRPNASETERLAIFIRERRELAKKRSELVKSADQIRCLITGTLLI